MKRAILIILMTSFNLIHSQVGGESVFQFLNLPTSSRQIALGGEVLTLTDDVNQPLWSPATLNVNLDRQLAINYTNYLAGISLGSVSYAHILSRRFGTLYGNITYLNYGSLIEADELGNETGTFNASDVAFTLGYSYRFPRSDISIGINTKFINSSIGNFSSSGLATDIGISYYNPTKSYSFALVFRNIGTQVQTFNGTSEKLPFKVALGGSYKLEYVPLKWYVTVDNLQQWDLSVPNPSNQTSDLEGNVTEENISFLENAFRHFVVGAELFPESIINLRAGFNFRRAAELKLQNTRTFSGISLGFGIKMNRLRFNYAFSRFHSADNTSTFSLLFDLDRR